MGGHKEGNYMIREAGHSSHLLMSYNPVCMKHKHTPRESREKKGHTLSAKRNMEEAVPVVQVCKRTPVRLSSRLLLATQEVWTSET